MIKNELFKAKLEKYYFKTIENKIANQLIRFNKDLERYVDLINETTDEKIAVKTTLKPLNTFEILCKLQAEAIYQECYGGDVEKHYGKCLACYYENIVEDLKEEYEQGDKLYWYDIEISE